jgi:hypothetical protein
MIPASTANRYDRGMKLALFATLATNAACLLAVIYALTGHRLLSWIIIVLAAMIIGTMLLRLQARSRR